MNCLATAVRKYCTSKRLLELLSMVATACIIAALCVQLNDRVHSEVDRSANSQTLGVLYS
jgi:hypothetical protein